MAIATLIQSGGGVGRRQHLVHADESIAIGRKTAEEDPPLGRGRIRQIAPIPQRPSGSVGPVLLLGEAGMVDPLSLWLSLPDGADDRIAAAKDALLGQARL